MYLKKKQLNILAFDLRGYFGKFNIFGLRNVQVKVQTDNGHVETSMHSLCIWLSVKSFADEIYWTCSIFADSLSRSMTEISIFNFCERGC